MQNLIKWVIDADIARSASVTEYPDSRNCRIFLEKIREYKHYIVMTAEIKKEWDKHKSVFSRKWLANMIAKRKYKFYIVNDSEKFAKKLKNFEISDKDENIARKDSHLIDAALKADKFIASGDDTARNVFVLIAEKEIDLKKIYWVNPKKSSSEIINWLQSNEKLSIEWILFN